MVAQRIVILGNGGAAIHAAQAARASGHGGEIHMVSDVDAPAFNPMLSPYYLKGVIPWENCFPFGHDFYRRHDITCHFDVSVESLDPMNQEVHLTGGENLNYDKCLVATGANPIIPPVPGLRESTRAYPLRTAVSVQKIEKAITSAKKVIVLGASLVGLKVAEVLAKRGERVILLDVADQMLPRGAHPSSAAYLGKYFEEHGIEVRLGCTLTGMEGAPEGVACHFPDNILEEADFVAVCTGVRPNVDFIDRDGVDVQNAVLVDKQQRTNRQNLYAAGDVSQGYNVLSGNQEWLGTWGYACYQGRIAGCNMAGKEAWYPGFIPQNISPFFDWTYAQIGNVQGNGEDTRHVAFGDPRNEGYVLLSFTKNQLMGCNLINCTHLSGKFKRMIIQKWDWARYLKDPDKYFSLRGIERILAEAEHGLCCLSDTVPNHEILNAGHFGRWG